jgi:hypothetical protein
MNRRAFLIGSAALLAASGALAAPSIITTAKPWHFRKPDPRAPAFEISGSSIRLKAGSLITIDGNDYEYSTAESVSLPTLTAGEDYRIFGSKDDGTLYAIDYNTAPDNAEDRLLGGFHFAPGGNATAFDTGGNTTPAINPYSIWDEKFRPSCADPRGMAFIGSFWCDIYLLNTNSELWGTSRNNKPIANGTNKPLRPSMFGGNGAAVTNMHWWAAAEIMHAHGKQLLSYGEFCAAAFGVRENRSRGNAPTTSGLATTNTGSAYPDHHFTSARGLIQATGTHWIWGRDFMYGQFDGNYGIGVVNPTIDPKYHNITEGRGQFAQEDERATRGALFGGKFNNTVESGSRCLDWADALQETSLSISARGRADHVCLI